MATAAESAAQQAPATAVVTAATAGLHRDPDATSRLIATLKKGDPITLLARKSNWFLVGATPAGYGWVDNRFVSNTDGPSTVPQLQGDTPAVGSSQFLHVAAGRVRKAPSLKADILFNLRTGDEVLVINQRNAWYRILTWEGRSGWAHSRLFNPFPPGRAAEHHPAVSVDRIWIERSPPTTETLFIALNAFNLPHTFLIDGAKPRLVCDFYNADLNADIEGKTHAANAMIRGIRTAAYGGRLPRVRIVVDLPRIPALTIDPVFYKTDNRFALVVKQAQSPD